MLKRTADAAEAATALADAGGGETPPAPEGGPPVLLGDTGPGAGVTGAPGPARSARPPGAVLDGRGLDATTVASGILAPPKTQSRTGAWPSKSPTAPVTTCGCC